MYVLYRIAYHIIPRGYHWWLDNCSSSSLQCVHINGTWLALFNVIFPLPNMPQCHHSRSATECRTLDPLQHPPFLLLSATPLIRLHIIPFCYRGHTLDPPPHHPVLLLRPHPWSASTSSRSAIECHTLDPAQHNPVLLLSATPLIRLNIIPFCYWVPHSWSASASSRSAIECHTLDPAQHNPVLLLSATPLIRLNIPPFCYWVPHPWSARSFWWVSMRLSCRWLSRLWASCRSASLGQGRGGMKSIMMIDSTW